MHTIRRPGTGETQVVSGEKAGRRIRNSEMLYCSDASWHGIAIRREHHRLAAENLSALSSLPVFAMKVGESRCGEKQQACSTYVSLVWGLVSGAIGYRATKRPKRRAERLDERACCVSKPVSMSKRSR